VLWNRSARPELSRRSALASDSVLAGSTLGDPSAHRPTADSGRFSRLTGVGSTAQAGLGLGQQTTLHPECVADLGSTDPTVGDQDLAQELPGFLLRLECQAELLLRDQAVLDQDLTQQTPRLFSRAWRPTRCFAHNPMVSRTAEVSLKSHQRPANASGGTRQGFKPLAPLLAKGGLGVAGGPLIQEPSNVHRR